MTSITPRSALRESGVNWPVTAAGLTPAPAKVSGWKVLTEWLDERIAELRAREDRAATYEDEASAMRRADALEEVRSFITHAGGDGLVIELSEDERRAVLDAIQEDLTDVHGIATSTGRADNTHPTRSALISAKRKIRGDWNGWEADEA